ncbi:MAG: hypothetical protein V3T86_04350 [Planctomycetota bacterium]
MARQKKKVKKKAKATERRAPRRTEDERIGDLELGFADLTAHIDVLFARMPDEDESYKLNTCKWLVIHSSSESIQIRVSQHTVEYSNEIDNPPGANRPLLPKEKWITVSGLVVVHATDGPATVSKKPVPESV